MTNKPYSGNLMSFLFLNKRLLSFYETFSFINGGNI